MMVRVRIRYSSSKNSSAPSGVTTVSLNTTDTSHSALKAMIEAKYPGWSNIQIIEIIR